MDYSKYFCGKDGLWLEYDSANYVIVPVPYDGTSTWIKGSDKGPEAIIEASGALEMYDIPTSLDVSQKGIFTANPITANITPDVMVASVKKRISRYLEDKKIPIIIGGEHSVSIGAFLACSEKFDNLSILQFDAHADLRQSYEGSKYNHACTLARAKEVAHIVQVGIRSACKEDIQAMTPQTVFFREYLRDNFQWKKQVSEKLKNNVYITIDLDVFDPSIMPSTGTPKPDGLLFHDVIECIENINKNSSIIGFDIVELCPCLDKAPNFLAAKLIYRIISIIENR